MATAFSPRNVVGGLSKAVLEYSTTYLGHRPVSLYEKDVIARKPTSYSSNKRRNKCHRKLGRNPRHLMRNGQHGELKIVAERCCIRLAVLYHSVASAFTHFASTFRCHQTLLSVAKHRRSRTSGRKVDGDRLRSRTTTPGGVSNSRCCPTKWEDSRAVPICPSPSQVEPLVANFERIDIGEIAVVTPFGKTTVDNVAMSEDSSKFFVLGFSK